MEWPLTQYNLIVTANTDDPIFSNLSGRTTFRADRLFKFTEPELKERYENDLSGLSELPTLVLGELFHGNGTPAFFGRVSEIEKRRGTVQFRFERLFNS